MGLSNKALAIVSGIIGTTAIGGGATAIYLTSDNNKDIKTSPSTQKTNTENTPEAPKTATNKSISEFLKGKNLELIVETEKDKWDEKWKAFQRAYRDSTPPEGWDLGDWASKKDSQDVPAEFKSLCRDKGNKQITSEEDNDFKPTETYCTKPVTVAKARP